MGDNKHVRNQVALASLIVLFGKLTILAGITIGVAFLLRGAARLIGVIGVIVALTIVNSSIQTNRWVASIEVNRETWGDSICDAILKKNVLINMTPEMVKLAWGKPNKVDQREETAQSRKFRWVYGRPRVNARYVWFKNDAVVKIQSNE